jgi:PTH2 family peptidyl-tRNA hydrolase
MSYKQVILVRKDLKMSAGKLSSQVAHGSTEAAFKSDDQKVKAWMKDGMKKVVLKVSGESELLKFKEDAEKNGLVCALIRDAGKTQIKPGTATCLAIGPDKEEKIDKVTGKLKVY